MKKTLESIVEKMPLDGSKAYAGGLLMVGFGLGSFLGFAHCNEPIMLIGNGLGLIGIRHALSKANFEMAVAVLPQFVAIVQDIRKRQIDPDHPIEVPDINVGE